MTESLLSIDAHAAEQPDFLMSRERGMDIIGQLLRAQAEPSAVEVFSEWHEDCSNHRLEPTYRRLLPVGPPGEGQQYAFSVDLDACTACKSCVSACHSLNGLDEGEMWRSVGTLTGGTTAEPYRQAVTTACHHCVEPACMHGCPVNAYEKDPITGIVKHLDDQCIGCKYCVLSCPYEVPRFSPSRGIVRKCDMCSDRLAEGEAPACVQGCPNDAISITVVTKNELMEASAENPIAGSPDPEQTIPSTRYLTKKMQPSNTRPVDLEAVRPQEGHLPLTVMLVLTQLSVGGLFIDAWFASANIGFQDFAIVVGLMGLVASTLHLGRPHLAFRAVIGVRRSWLSREILAFGAFGALAVASFAAPYLPVGVGRGSPLLMQVAIGFGLVGIFASAMIYKSTGRPTWRGIGTPLKFFLRAGLLGSAAHLWHGLSSPSTSSLGLSHGFGLNELVRAIVIFSVIKLALDLQVIQSYFESGPSPLRSSAQLLLGRLRPLFLGRLVLGVTAGIAAPLLVLSGSLDTSGWTGGTILIGLLVAELMQGHLFFVSATAPRMPGEV